MKIVKNENCEECKQSIIIMIQEKNVGSCQKSPDQAGKSSVKNHQNQVYAARQDAAGQSNSRAKTETPPPYFYARTATLLNVQRSLCSGSCKEHTMMQTRKSSGESGSGRDDWLHEITRIRSSYGYQQEQHKEELIVKQT